MVHRLIAWAVQNRLVVILAVVAITAVGIYSFLNINVEAYPDPAPAIIEVIAQYPGASAEEVERKVTIPLEIALAGMPGLSYSRSKSLFGLGHLRNQFEYGTDYFRARLEVLNRLNSVDLPPGVKPEIAPTSPTGEIYRYILKSPQDADGKEIYTLYDLKALNDWKLEKDFRRVPRIADVVSFGGAVKRYEIHPDPERMKQYGITLEQLENAIRQSNANVGGDYLRQGDTVQAVRGLGLVGGGQDPTQQLKPGMNPKAGALLLRAEEGRRLREIRQIVLMATNNVPIKIADVVEGGRHTADNPTDRRGVVVGHQTRAGRVATSQPKFDAHGNEIADANGQRIWEDHEDIVQGVVLLRKGEKSLPALADVHDKVAQLSQPGQLLPGVKLETIYDRTDLIKLTTATVRENVLVGIGLVVVILLVFLNDTRSALIVALNIPLSLLFAFTVLYFSGRSTNLLSLGAVDFGIIVDSSVIMVEAIYRRLSSGEDSGLPLAQRILRSSGEVERSLLYSRLIIICALLPLFTMTGPEGQIFGPMADAYALALLGALLFALTLSPVLCRIFMQNLKQAKDNFLVLGLKRAYMRQLEIALRYRAAVLVGFAGAVVVTFAALPFLGREFMPALEEGNIYIRGTYPVKVSLEEVTQRSGAARRMLRRYPEVNAVLCQMGRPDDGTDPTGYYNAEFQVPLKPEEAWPKIVERTGWRSWLGPRARTKSELVDLMQRDLDDAIPGVDWNFSQQIRDNVMETLSGVKGENSIKIIGPDLDELERIARQVRSRLTQIPGIQSVGIFPIKGQTNLEFSIDREKCAMWNVSVDDVQDALQTAVAGKAFTQMVEGERTFDITIRWPEDLRRNENLILDIPVDVLKNRVVAENASSTGANGGDLGLLGTNLPLPAFSGSTFNSTYNNAASVPRRRLRDLVVPVDEHGAPNPAGKFVRTGASTIAREQGKRLIAIKFSVRNRDLASAVAEAQKATQDCFHAPYVAEWSGEFQEMNEALHRLTIVVAVSLLLIVVLLYMALASALDVAVVFANVIVLTIGGIWALILTGSNFNISAGVGFISILGVGMMNGLILISGFNQRRAHGLSLHDALRDGMNKRIRPLTMTCLTAIFGMLPAAFSTRIGSQTQQPLAIVVVGGMITTMLMMNLMPVLYSFYGDREPPAGANIEH